MELERDVQLALGALLVALLLSCAGAIGLLARMTPAIEQILSDNDYSLQAADEMLAVLVLSGGDGVTTTHRERAAEALERARQNITEQEEQLVLEDIARQMGPALEADGEARQAVVISLQRLAAINRAAFRRADDEAQRLGTGGAWAMVLLGLTGFAVGLLVTRRLLRRVVEPVAELCDVLNAALAGDHHRRCHIPDTSSELALVMRNVNALLDEQAGRGAHAAVPTPSAPPGEEPPPSSGEGATP